MSMSNDAHRFEEPEPTASRSPCPALNAAASHGYLPRSGRNISFMQFLNALQEVYNISLPLALVLTCGGFLKCGHNGRPTIPFFGTMDLHDLARHGRVEHDGSLAHADAELHAVFAPTSPDQMLLEDMLTEAPGRDLDMEALARVRSKRDTLLAHEGRSLDRIQAEVTRGEIALLLSVIGDGEKVSPQRLQQWLGEDRLPDGWTRPQHTQGLIETIMKARKIEAAVNKINISEGVNQIDGNNRDDPRNTKQD